MRWLWLFLLIPAVASANCAAWRLCPYTIDPDDPSSRWVSIARTGMPDWEEIEVAGNEANGGQALVCFKTQQPPDLTRFGCTAVQRGDLDTLLSPPFMPYLDHAENKIKFLDGQAGRQLYKREFNSIRIRKRIHDDAITTEVLSR